MPACRRSYAVSVYFGFYQFCCCLPRRHCCARRDMRTIGRRRLGCTSTRSAERQRIIGAEASRIAMLTRQRRAMGSAIGKHCSSSNCSLAMGNAFLLDGRRPFSFSGKKMGVASRGTCAALTFAPVRKRKNSLSRKRISPFPASPARCRGKIPHPSRGIIYCQ